jgi:hypothetical protein
VLFGLGLFWLAAYLWSAHASVIGTRGDPVIVVTEAALTLPGLVAATMLAGAATSNAATMLAGAAGTSTAVLSRRTARAWSGLWLAAGCGLLVGGAAAGLILFGYGHRSSVVVLAWAVLAAGVIGGLLGGSRPVDVVTAGLAATFGPFLLDFLPNLWQGQLLRLFGAGTTVASQFSAVRDLSIVEALVAGLIAGLVGFLYLRRARGTRPGLPGYLTAGVTPGVLLLAGEVVTRIGGARLFDAAGKLSAFDQVVIDYTNGSRLNHGLVVLFVGGFAALIGFGATLKPR